MRVYYINEPKLLQQIQGFCFFGHRKIGARHPSTTRPYPQRPNAKTNPLARPRSFTKRKNKPIVGSRSFAKRRKKPVVTIEVLREALSGRPPPLGAGY